MRSAWIKFIATQIFGFSVGAYFVRTDFGLVLWIWALTGLVGFILGFFVSSLRLHHTGAGRYLLGLTTVLTTSIILWALIILLCAVMHISDNPTIIVSLFFLWLPALVLWSAGWFSLLIFGPFIPTKEEVS